jgi:hypothetical protein
MWKDRHKKAVRIFFWFKFRKSCVSYFRLLLFGDVGGVWWLSVLDELIGQADSKPTRWSGKHQRALYVQHRSWIAEIRTKEGGG